MCTLVVDQYVYLAAFHNADTRICRPEVNANDVFSRFDVGGLRGAGNWENGERADKNKEE